MPRGGNIYKSDFISILKPLFISMFTTMLVCSSISWRVRLVKQCETVGRSLDRTHKTKKNRNPLIKKPHHGSKRSLKLSREHLVIDLRNQGFHKTITTQRLLTSHFEPITLDIRGLYDATEKLWKKCRRSAED